MKGHVRSTEVVPGIARRRWNDVWKWRGLAVGLGMTMMAGAVGVRPAVRAQEQERVANIPTAPNHRPRPSLTSRSYVVIDRASNETLLARDEDEPRSIASLTKLMSVMVYMDMEPDLTEVIEITKEDRKGARPAATRLQRGYQLMAEDLVFAALVSSENPAVEALARSTGLTRPEFVGMMNRKAQELGMAHSIFFDASGLDANNTSTPRDVARMLEAASSYPLIQKATTTTDYQASVGNKGKKIHYYNSNRLARSSSWDVVAGKTGYISDAGYCLAVAARAEDNRELLMVFLGAPARGSRFGDAARAMDWIAAETPDTVVSNE